MVTPLSDDLVRVDSEDKGFGGTVAAVVPDHDGEAVAAGRTGPPAQGESICGPHVEELVLANVPVFQPNPTAGADAMPLGNCFDSIRHSYPPVPPSGVKAARYWVE